MHPFPDYAQISNLSLLEELYAAYIKDPAGIDPSWRRFFEGMDFALLPSMRMPMASGGALGASIEKLIDAYRRHGHLLASLNPLSSEKRDVPELDPRLYGLSGGLYPSFGFCKAEMAPLEEIIASLQSVYSSRIGFEYMDLGRDLQQWMQGRIEPQWKTPFSREEKLGILADLERAEFFEEFLHTHYTGQTRFSLEGLETAIPLFSAILEKGMQAGVEDVWIGMAHRGRLNVLANILRKPLVSLFSEFEEDASSFFEGNDDVKYHMGWVREYFSPSGKKMRIGFPANPSHLESIDPVLLGQTRAIQGQTKGLDKVLPILVHGDAAIAGQGVVYESMQLMRLPGYTVGGAIHLVLNNQIGYTTSPSESRSTRYCTDIAKTFSIPVFHLNAEDPESCVFAARLAVEIRQKFQTDVILDLIGYRKYGHNEGDEPSYTQPLQYQVIRSKSSIRKTYAATLIKEGIADQDGIDRREKEEKHILQQAWEERQSAPKATPRPEAPPSLFSAEDTGVGSKILEEVLKKFCTVPQGFHPHPKLGKWLEKRKEMILGKVDWPTGEMLAFGSLLAQGIGVRLAGQDSQRGTFSQRHIVWVDTVLGQTYCPMQSGFEAVNSPLTEYAGLGFEYGYSCCSPKMLILWEAQYGDFDNGAQIIIDQYIASAQQKWNISSSLVLLLPHGYEGAGPEHSSARLERFLQLCAKNNMSIVNATTSAQYFHLLRRQAMRVDRRPLIVFAPKALLRAKESASSWEELTEGCFHEILADPVFPSGSCGKIILCSGKIYYDLVAEREKRQSQVPILRLEQLYPLHEKMLRDKIAQYEQLQEILWVQEEPENMGAWNYLALILQSMTPPGARLRCVSRPANATPATGSHRKHKEEQILLMEEAYENRH